MDQQYGVGLLVANLKSGIVRVLVIDDDPDICMGLKDILQDAGYHVETASCAADGRDHFDQQTYSILVVDYSLPDANGIEIAQMVRAHYPWVQTILMTGHDRVEISKNHENSPLLGAFLRKPIDVQTILSVMEQMLHRQCDHFQIARFSPQHEPTPPPAATPKKDVHSAHALPSAPVTHAPQKKGKTALWFIPIFVVGMVVGWYGHDVIREPHKDLRRPEPIAVAIPVPAAAPIQIQPEENLLPPPPVVVEEPASPVPAQVVPTPVPTPPPTPPPAPPPPAPIPAPAKTPELPPIDWNSQLNSDNASLRLRGAKVLLKESPNHEMAIATLLEFIEEPDSDPAMENAAKEELIRLGKAAVPALILKLENPNIRAEVVDMLGAMGPAAQAAVPAITALENDPEVGIAALRAIAQIQPR